MFKVNFVYYRSDKYSSPLRALESNAMFQPSSNISAWELQSETLEQVREVTELCSMYRSFSGKTKVFGICTSNIFISADEVVKYQAELNSGNMSLLELILIQPKAKSRPTTQNTLLTNIRLTRGKSSVTEHLCR